MLIIQEIRFQEKGNVTVNPYFIIALARFEFIYLKNRYLPVKEKVWCNNHQIPPRLELTGWNLPAIYGIGCSGLFLLPWLSRSKNPLNVKMTCRNIVRYNASELLKKQQPAVITCAINAKLERLRIAL